MEPLGILDSDCVSLQKAFYRKEMNDDWDKN
jgi:hypothetical protein